MRRPPSWRTHSARASTKRSSTAGGGAPVSALQPEEAVEAGIFLREGDLRGEEGAQRVRGGGGQRHLPGFVGELEFDRAEDGGPEEILERAEVIIDIGVGVASAGADLAEVHAAAAAVLQDQRQGRLDETLLGGHARGGVRTG